jgi:hypothetical protein
MNDVNDIKKGYTPVAYRPPTGHNPGTEGTTKTPPKGDSGVPKKSKK